MCSTLKANILNNEIKYAPVSHIPPTDRRLKDSHRQATAYTILIYILTTTNTTYQSLLPWGGAGGG